MTFCNLNWQLILLLSGVALLSCAEIKDKRQVGTAVVDEGGDRETAETGFAEAVQAGSKYFQYAHVPAKDHYEFGHRRGNEHHFIERHEKAHPHAGEFKTKVRWGDKHGGYGEHYWDYNHAGHGHDGDGEESQNAEDYTAYEASEEIPSIKSRQRRDLLQNDDVEFIDDRARYLVESGSASKHGGNYRREPFDAKIQRKRQNSYVPSFGIPSELDFESGKEGDKVFRFVRDNY